LVTEGRWANVEAGEGVLPDVPSLPRDAPLDLGGSSELILGPSYGGGSILPGTPRSTQPALIDARLDVPFGVLLTGIGGGLSIQSGSFEGLNGFEGRAGFNTVPGLGGFIVDLAGRPSKHQPHFHSRSPSVDYSPESNHHLLSELAGGSPGAID
jgi:hypothetical protein